MGCTQSRYSMYTPPRGLERLKEQNGYVRKGNEGRPIAQKHQGRDTGKVYRHEVVAKDDCGRERLVARERERMVNGGVANMVAQERQKNVDVGNISGRILQKKITGDELVDGWPKWLVDNIQKDVLGGLVPKSVDSYDKLAKVGQGTYSNVYKARDRDTGKIVALKKVRFDTSEPESIKFMAREIMILQKLDHPNVIKLEGLATSRMQYSLYLVFDCMQTDLARVACRPDVKLTEPQVKCYMQQLLSGLEHCHERGILHRDIKGSNLLIDKTGMLKIADFGLANFFDPNKRRPLTSRVVTLWYRAPELLLGSTDYGVGIDLWSAGCLLAEMFMGRPFMPGKTEVEQLHKIFKLCGSPPEDYWKRLKLPATFRPPQPYKSSYQETFKDFPAASFGLLTTLLSLDPTYRGTAASALQDEVSTRWTAYFLMSSPLACDLSGLPIVSIQEDEPVPIHDKKKRRKAKHKTAAQQREVHDRKNLILDKAKGDPVSSKEKEREKNVEPSLNSREFGDSASSTVSSGKGSELYENHSSHSQSSRRSSPFADVRPHHNGPARTEGHPNALKNIKNFPLLAASGINIVNYNDGDRLNFIHRSLSMMDYRDDHSKIMKLFAVDAD
ncbi:Protein kinase domain [Dillenia turbinata]|uniref:Protein kinase domain n=1 Tax=Dillenia turbinata TaxID=194707 RepID=A0AAN8VAG9_9MAGN